MQEKVIAKDGNTNAFFYNAGFRYHYRVGAQFGNQAREGLQVFVLTSEGGEWDIKAQTKKALHWNSGASEPSEKLENRNVGVTMTMQKPNKCLSVFGKRTIICVSICKTFFLKVKKSKKILLTNFWTTKTCPVPVHATAPVGKEE